MGSVPQRRTVQTSSRPGKGKPQGWQAKLLSWQAMVAAGIGAAATIIAAIISIHGGSTESVKTPVQGSSQDVAISSFSLNPISVYGTVQDWSALQGEGAEIFVVVPRTGNWLVSPPADVFANDKWAVSDWKLNQVPTGQRLTAVIMLPAYTIGNNIVTAGSAAPASAPLPGGAARPTTATYVSELAQYGPNNPSAQAISSSIRVP